MHHQQLFDPITVGAMQLPNRILMAPLTRSRAEADHTPTDLMAEYYAQRASAGLIIAEATMAIEGNSAFGCEPGIYSPARAKAWWEITEAVHNQGGRIALQIWHGGRACHPLLNDGAQPVAPSPIAITNDEAHTPEGKKPYTVPRELRDDEVPTIVEGFRTAATHALAANFDAIEIHGANGYLLDSFLRDGSNRREGPYGGSNENRARLLLEVIDSVSSVIGSDRVGVRISPLNSFNSMRDSDPIGLSTWLAKRLNDCKLAYLHVMRSDFLGEQKGDVMSAVRNHYNGTLIGNMGYTASEAAQAVQEGTLDAVAFGTSFLANPDLPKRFAKDAPLNEPDSATFYTPGPKGYTDYPTMDAVQ